jgi:hypothetical protein
MIFKFGNATTLLLFEKNKMQFLTTKKNKINYFDNSLGVHLSASDYRLADNRASVFESQYLNEVKNWPKNKSSYIEGVCGKQAYRNFIGLGWQNHARKIFRSFHYAEKIKKHLGITEHIEIWPEYFHISVYEFLQSKGALPQGIKINKWAKVCIKIRGVAESIYSAGFALFYSEIILFKLMFAKNNNTYNCDVAVNIEDKASSLIRSPQVLLKRTQAYRCGKIIYIRKSLSNNSIKLKSQDYTSKIIDANDHSAVQTFSDYLINDYLKNIKWKLWSLIHIFLSPLHSRSILKSVQNYAYWKAFHRNLKPKLVLNFMVREDLIASYLHSVNECKSMFVYFSTTQQCIMDLYDSSFATCYDYAHMKSNYIYSTEISNEWLRTQEVDVDNYINDLPIYSGLIRLIKRTRNKVLDKKGIDSSKIVISFFDVTVGQVGVVSESQYIEFLDAIFNTSKIFPNAIIIFKSKYQTSNLELRLGVDFKTKLAAIRLQDNILFAENLSLSGHWVIGISNIVISLPLSSIIYEGLASDVPVILYNVFEKGGFSNALYDSYGSFSVANTKDELFVNIKMLINKLKFNEIKPINKPVKRKQEMPHTKLCKQIDRIASDC